MTRQPPVNQCSPGNDHWNDVCMCACVCLYLVAVFNCAAAWPALPGSRLRERTRAKYVDLKHTLTRKHRQSYRHADPRRQQSQLAQRRVGMWSTEMVTSNHAAVMVFITVLPWPLTFWPLGQCMPSDCYMVAFRCLANVAADSDETRRSIGSEFQMTAQKTAKSLASITVRVRRTTSFRVSADLKCRLLATDQTSTQSSARYSGANPWRHL